MSDSDQLVPPDHDRMLFYPGGRPYSLMKILLRTRCGCERIIEVPRHYGVVYKMPLQVLDMGPPDLGSVTDCDIMIRTFI